MAEEDIIFGKNRHFFGGTEPSNMIHFSATSDNNPETNEPIIKMNAKLPNDTIIEGQTLCTVAGAVIRKSTSDYPKDEFSGDMVANITEDQEIIDDNVTDGTTYYYAAFPYSAQGVYNRNKVNRIEITLELTPVTESYLFGYDLDLGCEDATDINVSYPSDVDNADFSPAFMDFDADTFNYGGWPSEGMFMPRPCMIKYDGTVAEYLDPNDYTKTTDNTESQVANPDFEGNAMMEWPKIYTKRWVENGIYHFRCSNIPVDDGYDCWSNYDKNDNQIEHFYTPIYFGSLISEKLRSISGQQNCIGNIVQTEINLAAANGEGWYTEFVADRLLIQDLLVMMAKNMNTQEKYGTGRCGSKITSAIGQGTMNNKGLFWGSTDQTSGIKIFGMENWWGNLWRRIAGWINVNGLQKFKITWGMHDGTGVSSFNLDGSEYYTVTTVKPSGTSGGYIDANTSLKYGRFPRHAGGGSATTFQCDGLWFDNNKMGYAAVGGKYGIGLLAGAFCSYIACDPTIKASDCGSALSYKPTLIQSGISKKQVKS